jgi:uncharacterized protein YfaA (DUF2138 family)
MQRIKKVALVLAGVVVLAVSALAVHRMVNRKVARFDGPALMVGLAQPDALIRTQALAGLPRDLLKVPLARAVLTEELVFYYDQHEDRLGLSGAIKRIAYEHNLEWPDKILEAVFNEPAELAFWRDGKGALRHYALVMRRNTLAKVLQQAATVAASDSQLKLAGEIGGFGHKASVLALEISPRRTLLLITRGEQMVVLSDPGMLFNDKNEVVSQAAAAVGEWLDNEGTLSRHFMLDGDAAKNAANNDANKATNNAKPARHTMVLGSATLALGYGSLMPAVKGLRFDFDGSWSSAVWLDTTRLAASGLGDAAVWRAAPANPAACLLMPLDWREAQKVLQEADIKPQLPGSDGLASLAALDGAALVCWYADSGLYTPVFIIRLRKSLPGRSASLQALALWAIREGGSLDKKSGGKDDALLWLAGANPAALAARGDYLVFSPDRKLVHKTLETIGHSRASVADQIPATSATLALLLPRPLSSMAEREMMSALAEVGNEDLVAAAKNHLPPKIKALAAFAPFRLELNSQGKSGWQAVEWRTEKKP